MKFLKHDGNAFLFIRVTLKKEKAMFNIPGMNLHTSPAERPFLIMHIILHLNPLPLLVSWG